MAKRSEKSEIRFEKSDKPIVFLDDREDGNDFWGHLKELGALVKVKRLAVGDAVVSDKVVLERKTAADFEQSIIDGRLFEQSHALRENFDSPIVCVVGREFYRIKPKALRGALIALAVDYRLPVFFFKNELNLAKFVFQLAEREQLKKPVQKRLRLEKKGFSLQQQQQFIVESLPMVGPAVAKNLLEQFGSVQQVFSASETELRRTKGIGKTRAKVIRSVVETNYGSNAEGKQTVLE